MQYEDFLTFNLILKWNTGKHQPKACFRISVFYLSRLSCANAINTKYAAICSHAAKRALMNLCSTESSIHFVAIQEEILILSNS